MDPVAIASIVTTLMRVLLKKESDRDTAEAVGSAVKLLIGLYNSIRDALRQKDEWNDSDEQAWRESLDRLNASPHFKNN